MKRQALLGQWNTPPHPLFASSSSSASASSSQQSSGMKKSVSMPAFAHQHASTTSSSIALPPGQWGGVSPSGGIRRAVSSQDFQAFPVSPDDPGLASPQESSSHDVASGHLAVPPKATMKGGHVRLGLLRYGREDGDLSEVSSSREGKSSTTRRSARVGKRRGSLLDRNKVEEGETAYSGNPRKSMLAQTIKREEEEGQPPLMEDESVPMPPLLDMKFETDMKAGVNSSPAIGNSKFTAKTKGGKAKGKNNAKSKKTKAKISTDDFENNYQEEEGDDAETRKAKRLARNRAAARMRRMKKKILADWLQTEVEEILRKIDFLSEVSVRQNDMRPLDPRYGVLDRPLQQLQRAFQLSNRPMNIADEEGIKQAPGFRKQKEERASALKPHEDMQLSELNKDDLQEFLAENLISGKTQDNTMSKPRRMAMIEGFLDFQVGWADSLRTAAVQNSVIRCLLSSQRDAMSDQAGSAMRIRHEMTFERYNRSENYKAEVMNSSPMPPVVMSRSAASNIKKERDEESNSLARKRVQGIDPFPLSQMYKQNHSPTTAEIQETARKLGEDLQKTVNFSPQQLSEIQRLSKGLQKEQLCAHAFHRIVMSLAHRQWLCYPEVEEMIRNFKGVLQGNQMSQFMRWTEQNVKNIDGIPMKDIIN